MPSLEAVGRTPTFVVGANRQRDRLDTLQRREQHLSESYEKNKPLCFNAKAYQKTHARKSAQGFKDADATLVSPMLLGVADGVSQIEEFGIDASVLPNQLLDAVEELAVQQLLPDQGGLSYRAYNGPIRMLREAYESTEAMGSTTILLGVMDNSTRIHGKLHPMIAVLSLGDCELLIIRRNNAGQLQQMFHTEMQRIDGHAQSPLQLARVGPDIDPNFDEDMAIEVIERGSAVHCVSAYEGDIVIMGSDGVFDNLYPEEILRIVEEMLPAPFPYAKAMPTERRLLGRIARRIVHEAHMKTQPGLGGFFPDAPIGRGGKSDDTSCVVGEVVEWTDAHTEAWVTHRRQKMWSGMFSCGLDTLPSCADTTAEDSGDEQHHVRVRKYPQNPNANSFYGSFSEYDNRSFASLHNSFATYRGGSANLESSYSEFGGGSFASIAGTWGAISPEKSRASRSPQKPRASRRNSRESRDDEENDENCAVM